MNLNFLCHIPGRQRSHENFLASNRHTDSYKSSRLFVFQSIPEPKHTDLFHRDCRGRRETVDLKGLSTQICSWAIGSIVRHACGLYKTLDLNLKYQKQSNDAAGHAMLYLLQIVWNSLERINQQDQPWHRTGWELSSRGRTDPPASECPNYHHFLIAKAAAMCKLWQMPGPAHSRRKSSSLAHLGYERCQVGRPPSWKDHGIKWFEGFGSDAHTAMQLTALFLR